MKPGYFLLVLCCTLCFVHHAKGARILGMLAIHGKSHFLMYEQLMKALADAGHRIDVVSHFPQKKPYPNYRDIINLAGTLPVITNNMTYDQLQLFQSTSMKDAVDLIGTQVCNLLELPELQILINNPPTDPPYDLVVAEFTAASCLFAFGRHLNVPVVALSSAVILPHANAPFGNPVNPAIVPDISVGGVSPMNFWQRLRNTLITFSMAIQMRYYMKGQNEVVKKHFGPEMPDIEELERELSLFLINTHPIFHGVRPLTPAIVEVAGLHIRDDITPIATEVQSWLDNSKHGFIYVSLGSMVKIESFPRLTLAEFYSAFTKIAPIRVLMKVANPIELPPGLPDNVLTLPWAPQVQILKHKNIRGFLTHGGLGGLQEALTFAVPLIGMPLFGDQIGNIRSSVERGIAVSLDYRNLQANDIVAAVNAIVHDPKYKNNTRTLSKQFLDRPRNARDTAVFWIEYILKYGGDSLRSPAVKLSWWQVELLDVYSSIIAAILVVLYILKIICRTILRAIFHQNGLSPLSKKRN